VFYAGVAPHLAHGQAVATNFLELVQNFSGRISGTSAATPTFAGIVSLINVGHVRVVLPPCPVCVVLQP
jgi:subtilase family serine protease